MRDETEWADVDAYFEETFVKEPPFIAAAYEASCVAKLPMIAVSPAQGKFLAFLVRLTGAKRVLELGTLGGYSALWMASALPEDGHLVTLDHNPVCSGVARANFAHAGLADRITLRYGEALDSLKALVGEKGPAFDLVFIDANKSDYPVYLDWCVRLSRPGGLIIADNVVRDGRVADGDDHDPGVLGLRAFHQKVGASDTLDATGLQLVGVKGYDGLSFIRIV